MQQGRAKTGQWVLEFEPVRPLRPDTLMGWAGGGDTRRQVRLQFDSVSNAKSYCAKHGIDATVLPKKEPVIKPKSYADNFKWDRPT